MADNEGKVTFTGDAQQLVREIEKLEKANDNLQKKLAAGTREAKQSAREQNNLAKQMQQALEKARTPAEQYHETIKKLRQALQQGIVTQEQFNRLRDVELRKLNELKGKNKELQQAENERGQRAKQIYSETRTALERYNLRVRELNDLMKRGALDQETHARAIRHARDELRQSGSSQGAFASGLARIGGYLSVGGIVYKGFQMWRDSNRHIISEAKEIAQAYDDAFRRFNVQAGLTGLQAKAAKASILGIAHEVAVPTAQASAAATQLVSSGFSSQEASGGSLRAFLEVLSASNIRGENVDPTALAKSLSQFLEANDLEKNEANVRRVGVAAQQLFKGTNLQIPGLTQLSKAGAAVGGLLTPEEQMAAYSRLVGTFGDEEAATGLRNVVQRLATASGSKKQAKVLQSIGLQTGDVDFVGEDLVTVLGRLKGAVEAAPEEKRAGILKQLFEEQGVAPARSLMEGIGVIQQNLGIQQGQASFAADLQQATSGRSAGATRQQITNEMITEKLDQQDDLISEELKSQLRAEGRVPFTVLRSQTAFALHRSLGRSPESSLSWSIPFGSSVTPESIRQGVNRAQGEESLTRDEFRMSINQLTQEIRKNTDATQQNTDQSRRQPAGAGPLDLNNRVGR